MYLYVHVRACVRACVFACVCVCSCALLIPHQAMIRVVRACVCWAMDESKALSHRHLTQHYYSNRASFVDSE